ncbi:MAG: hypothetical protein KJ749_00900 [Planctomycetes bacterium]|nr:hypothetical protein [Planctomycetota bacterium]
MFRNLAVATLCAVSVLLATGCACPRHRADHPQTAKKELLFNPEWANVPVFDTPRADWPSTVAYRRDGETIDYRETIIDRHGQSGTRLDRYYRRFEAVRTGQLAR